MPVLDFATGAISPSTALAKGLPFYRLRKVLTTPNTNADFFNINVPLVAAYVGPDSDFNRYKINGLTSLFGAQPDEPTLGPSSQVFTSKQHWCPRILLSDASAQLAGDGFALGFDGGDSFDLAALPFLGRLNGLSSAVLLPPVVDVYLWLVDPPQSPFLRNNKWYQANHAIALAAGVETTVLFLPTWGRNKVTLKIGPGAATQRTYNVYGGGTGTTQQLISTVVLAAADPAEEIVFTDWSWGTVLVTETALAGPDVALKTQILMED